MHQNGSGKIRRKQVCRRKTRLRNFRLRKFRRSQILHPQYLPLTLYTPFHCTLPRTFSYRACPFAVHCLLPIRQNFRRRKFPRRIFLWQTCLRRIFQTRVKQCAIKMVHVFGEDEVVRKFETVSLSHQTITRRVSNLGKHVSLKLKSIVENCIYIFFIGAG